MSEVELKKSLAGIKDQPDLLIKIILRQGEQLEALQKRVEFLEQEIREKSQSAAPFRVAEKKRKATDQKKRSGQKAGHKGIYLKRPKQVDEVIKVELGCCPSCQGQLSEKRELRQWLIDIPEIKPKVTELITYQAKCGVCGEVESHHPLKVSRAQGAAAVHLGANALGLATSLSQQQGLSKRKVCEVMMLLTGFRLSAGGLSQILARAAKRLEQPFKQLCQHLEQSSVLHTDETGWWVNQRHSLWVLSNQTATRYKIVQSKTKEELLALLGSFKGVLVSDCLNLYDNLELEQQKCYAHHLKAISKAQKAYIQKYEESSNYLIDWQKTLRKAMNIKAVWVDIPRQQKQETLKRLQQDFHELIWQARSDSFEQAVRDRLRKQEKHLLTFLKYPFVDATNNHAERMLRPAVIHRKISAGNKTKKGASTYEVLCSLATTCKQQAIPFSHFVADAFRLDRQPLLLLR